MSEQHCSICGAGAGEGHVLCGDCAANTGRCAACGEGRTTVSGPCGQCGVAPAAAERPARAGATGISTDGRAEPGADDAPPAPAGPFPRLTAFACFLCVAVFLGIHSSGALNGHASLLRWGYASGPEVWHGAPWALITSAFVHVDFLHLGMNLYWLWLLGGALERSVAPVHWVAFVAAAAWVSSGMQLLWGDTGIGMSGVGYALFGFGWLMRDRLLHFRDVVTDQTVRLFLAWLVGCMVATALNVMQIANGAHLGGLLFGAGVGMLAAYPGRRALVAGGLGVLLAATTLPAFWCPWSADWTATKAYEASVGGDYATAIRLCRQTLAMGGDKLWAWETLARIYGDQQRQGEYREAVAALRTVDARVAEQVEATYGPASAR